MQPPSILLPPALNAEPRSAAGEPECFHDLNLDQVVAAIAATRPGYDLIPFFHVALHDPQAIAYRQNVMRDLDDTPVLGLVRTFSARMQAMRERLAQTRKLFNRHEKNRWVLAAIEIYCGAVESLAHGLSASAPDSDGLRDFAAYLRVHVQSAGFVELATTTRRLVLELEAIRYVMHIRDNRVTVRDYDGEADYSAVIERTFDKFKRGSAKDYRAKFNTWVGLNHVEAQVLDMVAQLHPQTFGAIEAFCGGEARFQDPSIAAFEREAQFYVAYLDFMEPLRQAGLDFCYPQVLLSHKALECRDAFDLALAHKLVPQKTPVIRNDLELRGEERILVVSGPNQGGKTTFARTFGQLHYLARLGVPVPGTRASVFLCDQVLTHFEREEDIRNLRGKLQDDLVRIHRVLQQATADSVVVMNEIFSSTTVSDALQLSRRVLARLSALDLLCVCVTFIDELSTFDAKTVSLVSTVDARDVSRRTFKIERRPADGRSYAMAIAEKYRLTRRALLERIPT